MKDSDKLIRHKSECPKCLSADSANDLCRNGRRIFVAWFQAMPEESKVSYLFGMPKDMQDSILQLTGEDGIVMGMPEEPQN